MRWDTIERFAKEPLDPALWLPEYLPHWTAPGRAAARYRLTDHGLELRIEHDQPAWRPRDGAFRVSHVQTGHHDGQHRVGSDLSVTARRPDARLWTPTSGAIEVVASASADPDCMLGVWLVGHESTGPSDSGEICVAEVFGDTVTSASSVVRVGVKAHHDPRLTTDLRDVTLAIDATAPHTYGAVWDAAGVRIAVDGIEVHRSAQALDYPMQLMIDLWEFPSGPRRRAAYPKTAAVHEVRLRASA